MEEKNNSSAHLNYERLLASDMEEEQKVIRIANRVVPEVGNNVSSRAVLDFAIELLKLVLPSPQAVPVIFYGFDPLAIGKGAVLPMIPDSWRFGFFKTDAGLCFGARDNGALVAWDAVKDAVAATQLPAQPAQGEGLTDAQRKALALAAETLDSLDMDKCADSLRAILARQSVTLDGAAQDEDEWPDHGETVLRVQDALGITRTGWVSPDVILLRIEQLQKSAAAPQERVERAAVPEGWVEQFETLLDDYVSAAQETAVFNVTQRSGMTVRMARPRLRKLMEHVRTLAAAAPSAPVAQGGGKLTDEQAYEQSGYRHFMDLPTFKAFRAHCTDQQTSAQVDAQGGA